MQLSAISYDDLWLIKGDCFQETPVAVPRESTDFSQFSDETRLPHPGVLGTPSELPDVRGECCIEPRQQTV